MQTAGRQYLDVPTSSGIVLSRLRASIAGIQAHAADLDRTGAFPTEDLDHLHQIGALRYFANREVGCLDLMEALRLVGRANLSLGRIFEGHINGALLVDIYGSSAQRAQLWADLEEGRLFGVWNTEPSPGVRLEPKGQAWTLAGAKSYATGAGFVDRAVITAAMGSGERQLVIADGARSERGNLAAWSVRGMRATCSGEYDLTNMAIDQVQLLGAPGDYQREPLFSAGAWRFTAVQLGGIERILILLRDHLKGGALDAVRAAQFGKVLAEVRSAYLWVREAAERASADGASEEAVDFVLLTRGVVERAGLAVMEAATRLVGTRTFFAEHPLDQACRDLGLYLRQPAPDEALDRAARGFIARDAWQDDPLW